MEASEGCLAVLRMFEGLRLFAYPDPYSPLAIATPWRPWGLEDSERIIVDLKPEIACLSGAPWTIGYGTTQYPNGKLVHSGDTCTREQADEWLKHEVTETSALLTRELGVLVNQKMFDALVSLVYNVGPGRADPNGRSGILMLREGTPSTLWRKLHNYDYIGASEQFLVWNKAGGMISNGLSKRRRMEKQLFDSGLSEALDFLKRHQAEQGA